MDSRRFAVWLGCVLFGFVQLAFASPHQSRASEKQPASAPDAHIHDSTAPVRGSTGTSVVQFQRPAGVAKSTASSQLSSMLRPLILRVAPIGVAGGVAVPCDTVSLTASLADYLETLLGKNHRMPRFYLQRAFSDAPSPPSAPAISPVDAVIASAKASYVLQIQITAWDQKKFPAEVAVTDEILDAATSKPLFSHSDAVLDDGSGNFPDLVARVLADRICSRFAKHARDPRPTPQDCLTAGCRSFTLSYKIGGMAAAVALIALDAESARGGRRGNSRRGSRHRSSNMLPWGPNPQNADDYGYVPTRYQKRFIEHTLGMSGCYDKSQKPTKQQMKVLEDVSAQLRNSYYKVPNFYWSILYLKQEPGCINSVSVPSLRTIFIFTSLMNLLHWNRDEIAAVVGHEAGHLQDRYCIVLGQPLVALSLTAFRGALQVCEKHADNIGLQYVVGAGFDPARFAYTFAAFENVDPQDKSTRQRLFSTHPINRDRIVNVSHGLEALCNEGVARACQFLPLGASGSYGIGLP